MASKLIALSPYDAQNPLELSLREAYILLAPILTPPLKYTIPTQEEYVKLNRAIVYGILCEPKLAKSCMKLLHAIVNDGYGYFIKLVVEIVDGFYTKLFDFAKSQLIWVVSVMIDVCGVGFDGLVVSLLRQIVGGDFSDGNLKLSFEMVSLLCDKWCLILDEEPVVLAYGLYTFLRLLADHFRIERNARSIELVKKEIVFCVRVFREQFHLGLRIGRDLVRLLQDLFHVPEFRGIWKDLVLNPSSFGTTGFSDVSDIYRIRTSSRFILLRITPEMERQLRFLLTHVKLGGQIRHQAWFQRKFLFRPERESLIADIVRFICCGHHPSNEILRSDVLPRWALIGWLLSLCTKNYVEASVKLSLFYDWLFFDEKVDNVMNIEPAMLLMVKSLPKYVDLTSLLLEFLLLTVENFDKDRKVVILRGILCALSTLVEKGVIRSLGVLTSCNLLSPVLKKMLQNLLSRLETVVLQEPRLPVIPSPDVPPSVVPNASDMELKADAPSNTKLNAEHNPTPEVIDSAISVSSSCESQEGHANEVRNLLGKLGENFKSSSKLGQQMLEKILLLFAGGDSHEKLGDLSSEFVACEIKKALGLAGYKLFAPFREAPDIHDADDEVRSVTAMIIRTFICTQHPRIRELLLCWSRDDGCFVGARILSYALRLSYEAHEEDYGASISGEISHNEYLPLLKFHVEGYCALMSGTGEDVDRTIASPTNVDKKLLSKMIDDAFSSYRSFVLEQSTNTVTKESHMSPGKLCLFDTVSSSLWKRRILEVVMRTIFIYLSDLSVGDENFILLLVTQLDPKDLLSIQIDLGVRRYAVFGDDVQKVLQLVEKSVHWSQLDQLKFWGLVRSEFVVSEFPVAELLVHCFCSGAIDPKASGVAIGGLMTLCSCCAPTTEIVGAVMLLPDNKFPNFAAAILSHWTIANESMLSNNIADFFHKLEKKSGDVPLNWDDFVINQSALLFLLSFIEVQGAEGNNILDKLGLNLSDIRTRLVNPRVAMETG